MEENYDPAAMRAIKFASSSSSSEQETGVGCLHIDILKEILSLLPAKSLIRFKCVSKEWNRIICDPVFQMVQCQRSQKLSGFLFENICQESIRAKYVPIKDYQVIVQDTILDFLPEKVSMSSSSNGLLCGYKGQCNGLVIFVCNPAIKQYLKIEGPKGVSGYCTDIGLAFDPFCSSGNNLLKFNLVSMTSEILDNYTFNIFFYVYSSERRKWGTLMEVFSTDRYLHKGHKVFASGVLYWMVRSDLIVALDFEKEKCHHITVPIPEAFHGMYNGTYIGESEGRLQYVLILDFLRVWVLDCNLKWVPVLQFSLNSMEEDFPKFLYTRSRLAVSTIPRWIEPLVLKEGILLLKLLCQHSNVDDNCNLRLKFYTYNLGTRTMEEICNLDVLGPLGNPTYGCLHDFSRGRRPLSYHMSLAPLQAA